MATTSAAVALETGSVEDKLADSSDTIEAVYSVPFAAHATMEPMSCLADVSDGGCTLWGVIIESGV